MDERDIKLTFGNFLKLSVVRRTFLSLKMTLSELKLITCTFHSLDTDTRSSFIDTQRQNHCSIGYSIRSYKIHLEYLQDLFAANSHSTSANMPPKKRRHDESIEPDTESSMSGLTSKQQGLVPGFLPQLVSQQPTHSPEKNSRTVPAGNEIHFEGDVLMEDNDEDLDLELDQWSNTGIQSGMDETYGLGTAKLPTMEQSHALYEPNAAATQLSRVNPPSPLTQSQISQYQPPFSNQLPSDLPQEDSYFNPLKQGPPMSDSHLTQQADTGGQQQQRLSKIPEELPDNEIMTDILNDIIVGEESSGEQFSASELPTELALEYSQYNAFSLDLDGTTFDSLENPEKRTTETQISDPFSVVQAPGVSTPNSEYLTALQSQETPAQKQPPQQWLSESPPSAEQSAEQLAPTVSLSILDLPHRLPRQLGLKVIAAFRIPDGPQVFCQLEPTIMESYMGKCLYYEHLTKVYRPSRHDISLNSPFGLLRCPASIYAVLEFDGENKAGRRMRNFHTNIGSNFYLIPGGWAGIILGRDCLGKFEMKLEIRVAGNVKKSSLQVNKTTGDCFITAVPPAPEDEIMELV